MSEYIKATGDVHNKEAKKRGFSLPFWRFESQLFQTFHIFPPYRYDWRGYVFHNTSIGWIYPN